MALACQSIFHIGSSLIFQPFFSFKQHQKKLQKKCINKKYKYIRYDVLLQYVLVMLYLPFEAIDYIIFKCILAIIRTFVRYAKISAKNFFNVPISCIYYIPINV